jgi:hypothetical protein
MSLEDGSDGRFDQWPRFQTFSIRIEWSANMQTRHTFQRTGQGTISCLKGNEISFYGTLCPSAAGLKKLFSGL